MEDHDGQEACPCRDVAKGINIRTNAFGSQCGALSMVVEGRTNWFRLLAKHHSGKSAFNIDQITAVPDVQMVYEKGGMQTDAFDAVDARAAVQGRGARWQPAQRLGGRLRGGQAAWPA